MLILAGLAFITQISIAQTVTGVVSSSTIGDQETVSYTLEVSGADASDIVSPSPPDAEGLVLVSTSVSRGTNISITNGNVSRSVSYTWHYRPEREGTARILETSVVVGNQSFRASAVTVEVVPQAQRPQRRRRSPFGGFNLFDDPTPAAPAAVTEQDIFIRAHQSSREAYLNEQVTLDYQLYFRPGTLPRNSRQSDSWDAEGFWREELNLSENQTPEIIVENGIRYQMVSIRRVAVFPTRPGELSIDPLKIASEVKSPDADPFSSFFHAYSTVERASPALNITSKALPPGAPDGFSGAVGNYQLRADLSQNELEVGEALQLTVTVEGLGNIALIEPPEPDIPGIFEIYDPEVNTSKSENGNLIQGRKTFTWLMIPRSNGTFQIPPIRFVFFDPSREEYIIRTADLNPVSITGTSSGPVAVTSTASGFPVDDIALLKRDPRWSVVNRPPLHHRPWFYLLLFVPVLGLTAMGILRRRATRLATDTAWARNRRAHPLARKHLKNAKKLLGGGNPDEFYAALELAVLGFLGNRLNISERGLTRPQLAYLLAEAGVPATIQRELIQFLDACDAARFAPTPPEYSRMDEHLMQTSHILSSIASELEAVEQ